MLLGLKNTVATLWYHAAHFDNWFMGATHVASVIVSGRVDDIVKCLPLVSAALSNAARAAVASARLQFRRRLDEDMDLHFQLAHQVIREPSPPIASDASPAVILQEQVALWTKVWAPPDAKIIDWAGVAPPFPHLTAAGPTYVAPEDVKKVMNRYPAHKAQGADSWDLSLLATFPHDFFVHTAAFYHMVAAHGSWPRGFCANLMALLGKPSGGIRTVAKTPMLYRVWCGVRKFSAALWESPLPDWDVCRPGISALEVGLVRMLRTEVAVALSESVSCCFWDMEKFFDSVHHDVLLAEAVALGFPLSELSLAMQQHSGTRFLTYRMAISEAVAPTRSLLPGCFWAIPLVRVLLRREMASLAVHCPVSLTAYVDDVAQHAVGSDVVNHAVQAAHEFIGAARRL